MSSTSAGVYHVVHVKLRGKHNHYDVYLDNERFLCGMWNKAVPLKKHQAYAIAALLNGEKRGNSWRAKFPNLEI
jgi:hypothetical protein